MYLVCSQQPQNVFSPSATQSTITPMKISSYHSSSHCSSSGFSNHLIPLQGSSPGDTPSPLGGQKSGFLSQVKTSTGPLPPTIPPFARSKPTLFLRRQSSLPLGQRNHAQPLDFAKDEASDLKDRMPFVELLPSAPHGRPSASP